MSNQFLLAQQQGLRKYKLYEKYVAHINDTAFNFFLETRFKKKTSSECYGNNGHGQH